MDFQKLVDDRRSIRKFDASKQVTREEIEELIRCAQKAPSWKNVQASRYYAILDEKKCLKFREEALAEINFERSANAALLVTSFEKGLSGFEKDGSPSNASGDSWGYYDLGLASSLILLKAKDLGLDSLVMGIRDEKKIAELLDLPEEEEVVSVIAIGYAEEDPKARPRKDLEEVLHFVE